MTVNNDASQDASSRATDGAISELPERPDSIADLVAKLTPEIYQRLRTAIELGKWEDGNRLSSEQLEHCMEVVILYEARNLPAGERTGAPLAQQCESHAEPSVQPLHFRDEKKQ